MPNFTKMAIKSSFMKLLNEQPLNKISVRNIVEDCGINRNSFYYHFQDIPSLIEEIVTEEANIIIEKYPTINSINECFNVAFKFALENKKAV
ncbi:MAG: TetR family transcriptional regulator, partial [Oscillospiraceae bacterium]